MISLDSTNFLEALMGGAAATTNPTFYASYGITDVRKDFDSVANASGSLNGATEVSLVAAPSGGDLRHDVRDLTIFNGDTVDQTITIQIDVGASKFPLVQALVPMNGCLKLENSSGRWTVYDHNGLPVTSGAAPGFGGGYQHTSVEGRSTTTSATPQTKTTLTTPATLEGTYRVAWTAIVDVDPSTQDGSFRLQNITDAAILDGPIIGGASWEDSERVSVGGFVEVTFALAAKTFEIQFNSISGIDTVGIQQARIEIWRVNG